MPKNLPSQPAPRRVKIETAKDSLTEKERASRTRAIETLALATRERLQRAASGNAH